MGELFRSGNYFCSTHKLDSQLSLILVSKVNETGCHLLSTSWLSTASSNHRLMEKYVSFARQISNPIDVSDLRTSFRPKWRSELSFHLLLAERSENRSFETKTEAAAWDYEQLQSWGETNPVAILANFHEIDVNTMKARIAQARIKGLLKSPGQGKRLTNN